MKLIKANIYTANFPNVKVEGERKSDRSYRGDGEQSHNSILKIMRYVKRIKFGLDFIYQCVVSSFLR